MAETAAHLVDHVLPRVPVRQWVLAIPKRLRYFLQRDPRLVNAVLRIFLAEVEAALRAGSPDAPDGARFGAVTFVHRFGSALNANLHFHCCVIDGLFSEADEGVRFHPAFLTDRALAKVQQQTRRRVLKLFQRRQLLSPEAVETMQAWEHDGGFSVNAEVWVPSWDRAGLERLLRYCARPTLRLRSGQVFAGERLTWAEPDERLIYHLPKPRPDGQMVLTLTPLELMPHLRVRHPAGGLQPCKSSVLTICPGPPRCADPAAAQAPPPLPRCAGPTFPAARRRHRSGRVAMRRAGRSPRAKGARRLARRPHDRHPARCLCPLPVGGPHPPGSMKSSRCSARSVAATCG
jgi:hypothetical protein